MGRAIFFDLDGTLIDSEPLTEQVVNDWLSKTNLPLDEFDLGTFRGLTWFKIAEKLHHWVPHLNKDGIANELQNKFISLSNKAAPTLISGAEKAFRLAASFGSTAIVTGSSASCVEDFLSVHDLVQECTFFVSSEYYNKSKPDPESYLLAADIAKCKPNDCMVFEDSIAGVYAALTAGMYTIAIAAPNSPQRNAADFGLTDYNDLPKDFFNRWHMYNTLI